MTHNLMMEFGKSNPCHNPSGSKGGQFCSTSSSGGGILADADAAYFDDGSMIKEASKSPVKAGDLDNGGIAISSKEAQQYNAYAKELQSAAESNITSHTTVWRGMNWPEDQPIPKRGMFETDSLTSTSPKKDIAHIYTQGITSTESGTPVMLRLERAKGVIGYERKGGIYEEKGASEVLLPKGARFRITGSYKDPDTGVLTIRMYDKGDLNPVHKSVDLEMEFGKSNDCHNPSGPGGGQFCSAGSGGTKRYGNSPFYEELDETTGEYVLKVDLDKLIETGANLDRGITRDHKS